MKIEVDDEDSIISVGISSLSGSFCTSYSNNTYKPWPVTVCRCKIRRKVFWTMHIEMTALLEHIDEHLKI